MAALKTGFFHFSAIWCKKCCKGLMLGATKQRRNFHQMLKASLHWDTDSLTGEFKPFYLFTWKGKPQFLTLEGLVAQWAASGLCITDTCEHTRLWTPWEHRNFSTVRLFLQQDQVKKGYRENVGLGNAAKTPENAIHSSEGQSSDWSHYRLQQGIRNYCNNYFFRSLLPSFFSAS